MRSQPETTWRRDNRSLSDPSIQEQCADRRNFSCAGSSRSSGKGSLYRGQLRVCVANGEGSLGVRAKWVGEIHLHAEPLQPRVSRRRARDDSALSRGRSGTHSVVSACTWTSCSYYSFAE